MAKVLIECNIAPDEMWASIILRKPEDSQEIEPLTVPEISDYLKGQGVGTGVDFVALEKIAAETVFNKEFIIARGQAPVDGQDGYYEYAVPMEDKKSKPVVAEDGTVDYLNSLEISMVEEGQVFATYIPPTEGQPGYNVCCGILQQKPGKHISVLTGKGFTTSEDGKQYIAKISGRIYKDYNRVVVEPLYVVDGDLDITHGNIEFNGDVEVRGDVHSRLRIDAKGSIFINGHVGNCKIRAGGSITIGRGVQGKYNCELFAQGDIACSFVEHCNIVSGANVYAKSLMNCRVFARDSVIVASKLGCIIGGSINAMQSVQAKNIGNDAGIATKLFIGEISSFRRDLNNLKDRLGKLNEELEVFEQQLAKYERIGKENMTPASVQLKMQVLRTKVVRQAEKKEVERKISDLEDELRRARMQSFVKASGVVYPGVVIMTELSSFTQADACKDVCYRNHLNKIEMMSTDEFNAIRRTELANSK